MKNIKKLIILLLILSMFGLGKIGVDAAIKYEDEMINCAYAYKYCDGVLIKKFDVKLGRYNGAVAVFYSSSGDGMNIYKIEHIYFAYPRYNDDIFIYKNEKIYDLRTAYKASSPCLATRMRTGDEITEEKLKMIECSSQLLSP